LRVVQPGKPAQDGTYKLDPAADPKEIDAIRTADDQVSRGIYRLDGDTLTVCLGDGAPNRPREFRTGKDTGPVLLATFRRQGAAPAGAVLLKSFDPEKDRATPLRGAAKDIVSVEDGAWRIENALRESESGNFRVALGTLADGIPADGVLICRARVKLRPKSAGAWGDLELNAAAPSFHGYDWPRHLAEYRGEVTEWAEKEVRYPAEVFRKKGPPHVTVHVGLHGNGVLWVRDVALYHLPAPATPKPQPQPEAVLKPLRDAVRAREQMRDGMKARHEAGAVSRIALLAAEAELTEARVTLAEAEGDAAAVAARLEELVSLREGERDLIRVRVDNGIEPADVLSKADARVADAKAKLAKVKPPAPPAAAPPRPKP
ncbi:MAG TPA: TIGR03067 domain-containing protein, partial [Gemmata sp.]|nr:TIGR03067 domain-containing protein [Gemmata sp.]